ncbi:MAG: hypothetical protein ACE14S_03905 [Candidatus Bathyarchaeia archaeon]
MNLCENQKAVILVAILAIAFLVAFAFEQIDWKGLAASFIGEGSMAILVYWLLRKNASNTKEARMVKAIENFRKWFYYFPNKWSGYRTLIQSGTINKPEVEQPNTFADQIHESLEGLKAVGIVFKPGILSKIHDVIQEISDFGYELRRVAQLPPNRRRSTENINFLLEKGEAISKTIKAMSGAVDESLAVK